MGRVCCCFNIRDHPEEHVSTGQNCFCPNCIIHTLLTKCTAIFNKGQSVAPPTATAQEADPLNSDAASNNTQPNNVVTSAPRTLHFDAAAAAGTATATAMRSGQKQDEQIREGENVQFDHMEHDSKGDKSTGLQCESTAHGSESPLMFSVEDEEDVCPTCLEEYITENPKIVLQCSHTYHLSCIYEWMERSEKCPICDKMMIFDEAT
ncbi:hypothetical protein PTKIN_Ptkin17bG0144700 [Pterospermum kingtungense]